MAETRCSVCDLYGDGEQAPCHRCGHMPNRQILPGCYGSIHETTDLSKCCCPKVTRKDALIARMERLEVRVEERLGRLEEWAQAQGFGMENVLEITAPRGATDD